MKILMISTDRKIFDERSSVHERMKKYGNLVDELHIVVFSATYHDTPRGQFKISENTFAYATNSWNRWFYVFDAIRKGKRIIQKSKFKSSAEGEAHRMRQNFLITAQDAFETGFVGYRLANAFDGRLQLQLHTDFLSPHFAAASALNSLRVRMARYLFPKSDCIRVVSQRIKQSILESTINIQKSKINTLPIYVDTSRIEKREPAFNIRLRYSDIDPILLVVSRLEPEKNVGRAIKALSEISGKYSSAGLVIVGDGSERQALEEKAKQLGVRKRVKFAGWQENVYSYFYGADIYLHTALYEGYGMTLLEAALSRCPIVTTDVGVIGDVLENGEHVLVCPEKNGICFQARIREILAERVDVQKMTKRAKEAARNHLPNNEKEYLQNMKEGWEECGSSV